MFARSHATALVFPISFSNDIVLKKASINFISFIPIELSLFELLISSFILSDTFSKISFIKPSTQSFSEELNISISSAKVFSSNFINVSDSLSIILS